METRTVQLWYVTTQVLFYFILSQRAVPMMQAVLVWLLPSSEKSRTRGTEKIRIHTYVRTYIQSCSYVWCGCRCSKPGDDSLSTSQHQLAAAHMQAGRNIVQQRWPPPRELRSVLWTLPADEAIYMRRMQLLVCVVCRVSGWGSTWHHAEMIPESPPHHRGAARCACCCPVLLWSMFSDKHELPGLATSCLVVNIFSDIKWLVNCSGRKKLLIG